MKKNFLAVLFALALCSPTFAQWKPAGDKIKTPWGEQLNPKNVLPEYPRPIMERQDWKNLNGSWNYAITKKGEPAPNNYQGEILVPFAVESSLSGVGKTINEHQELWYQRTFDVPSAWKGKQILLHFGAVDWKADVWVNDVKVGQHTGGFTPFYFDITSALNKGNNQLVVKVWDPSDRGEQPRGKQVERPEGIWYTPVTGIWQTVWMEAVSADGLKSVFVRPDIDQKQLVIEPEFYNESANTLEIKLKDGNKTVAKKSVNCANSSVVVLPVKNMKLWSPEDPFLYDLVYQVKDAKGNVLDEVKSYAGMRKVHTANGRFYLNNQPYFQRLVLDQGFYPEGIWTAPSDEDLKNDIVLGKEAGFNGARLHQKVFEERYYYWADKLGYITWGESASWMLDVNKELAARNFLGEWSEVVVRDRNHPSLVTWTPFNETWGGGPDAYVRLVRDVYNITKAIDPTRPVNDASGDNHVITDIWSVHNYEQDRAKLTEQLKMEEGKEPYRNARDKDFLAVYEGQPYMVDEFGGIPWMAEKDRKNSWGYGGMPENAEAFYKRLEGQIDAFIDSPHVTGFCYTQLTDVEQEKNGIYYYDRTPKLDMKRIKAIFEKIK